MIIYLKISFQGVLKQAECNKVIGSANREVDSARYWRQEKTVWNQYNENYIPLLELRKNSQINAFSHSINK